MWPLWLNAPRYANHKTDGDIPSPTCFLGSGSFVHKGPPWRFMEYTMQMCLIETVLRNNLTIIKYFFLVTSSWLLTGIVGIFQQRPPHPLELWFLPLNTPSPSYSGPMVLYPCMVYDCGSQSALGIKSPLAVCIKTVSREWFGVSSLLSQNVGESSLCGAFISWSPWPWQREQFQ